MKESRAPTKRLGDQRQWMPGIAGIPSGPKVEVTLGNLATVAAIKNDFRCDAIAIEHSATRDVTREEGY
jgi:hypothetical protein